jgi:anti-sigma B factor antagonist
MTVETVADGPAGVRVLRASGELDIAVAPELVARAAELVEGAAGVVLDLATVTFIDSAGVRLVDRFARECARRDVRFVAVAPPHGRPRRVLEIVGFGPPLVVDELSTAIASVSPRTA